MPLVIKWERRTANKRQLTIILLIVFAAVLIIGKPMLVSAKNRLQNLMAASQFLKQNENYRQKHEILKVLSKSDLQLGDAMEITQTVVNESRRHDIPVALFLAIMKKESNFNVDAVSPVNAMGIMQIHPVTWDAYAKKLNLKVTREQAFNPALNIRVSAAILSDLRDQYQKKGYKNKMLWDYVLSAYYAGTESVKDGLTKNHRHYVRKVRQYADELGHTI